MVKGVNFDKFQMLAHWNVIVDQNLGKFGPKFYNREHLYFHLQILYRDVIRSPDNDSFSKIKNYSDFVENRHDQSVYSLLCKRYKLKSFSAYECDWACLDNKRTWEHNKYSPILAKRDLKYSIFRRLSLIHISSPRD